MSSIAVYFGRVVKQLREEARYSQEVLADKANLNRTYLGEVERGVAVPSLATINKIATALNLSTSQLIALSENHQQLTGSAGKIPASLSVD
ncbi:transcriptional regulator [Cellvibrio mixtus]|jgi:transcriptional regulator with XRE-family HTH domain|uniref:Transcriptional regulator n=1 Tax=Cellvibrio mixtus TaxID=39650 RepID=A0A266Q7L5_9GAMM|nr:MULTISPECIES: helix-turn-helix transcriptional regulator [Cellvibrio]AQT59620.1 transcriptional regulator [Cellvibrio sp. PSBB023]OZY85616.1 transcriptional regulator [Cellvibrio mixtus]